MCFHRSKEISKIATGILRSQICSRETMIYYHYHPKIDFEKSSRCRFCCPRNFDCQIDCSDSCCHYGSANCRHHVPRHPQHHSPTLMNSTHCLLDFHTKWFSFSWIPSCFRVHHPWFDATWTHRTKSVAAHLDPFPIPRIPTRRYWPCRAGPGHHFRPMVSCRLAFVLGPCPRVSTLCRSCPTQSFGRHHEYCSLTAWREVRCPTTTPTSWTTTIRIFPLFKQEENHDEIVLQYLHYVCWEL